MASAATDTLRGRRGGPYRILRRIAVGGMSEVFEAEAPGGERVVVKMLLPHLARTADGRSAFAHEAALGARLRDPHVVEVLDDGEEGGAPFLVLERVDGASLQEVLESGSLPLEAVLAVACDVLGALVHLHAVTGEDGSLLFAIHRDISPDNVLVDRRGNVKLADLGVARSRLRSPRTQTGIVRGKAAYLSPEQVTGSDVDARADLYALGAVLFEAATGMRFARGDTDLEVLRSAENPTFVAPSSAGADARLDPLLRRALARFPEDRPPSAAAMLRDVRALLAGLEEGAVERGRRALAEAVASTAPAPEHVSPNLASGGADKPSPAGGADKLSPAGGADKPSPTPARRWARRAPVVLGILVAAWLGVRSFGPEIGPRGAASVGETPSRVSAPSPLSTGTSVGGAGPSSSSSSEVAPHEWPVPTDSAVAPRPRATVAPASSAVVAVTASSAGPAAVPAQPTTAVLAPGTRESVQRRIAAISAALREAKAGGKDVSALEDRAAVALQAFLDGRYDDTNRELDSIAARIPK